jgi:hypothetical protein
MTTTTDGAPGRASRVRTPDAQFLRESSRRARERAEELLVRSATVLARSGDLRGLIGERAALVDPEEVRDLLRIAQARIANLERALVSNRRIGMALGVLMSRRGLTEEQAFDLLREQSSRRNEKLARLAEEVVYTGDL